MATKHGWVRNPLSVIAIFAGIAEVCAAVVLPLLDGEAQHRFMLFVMFFPCALVGLFFFVLWFKARVLYAPTDYQNDENWLHAQGLGVYTVDGEGGVVSSVKANTPPTDPTEDPEAEFYRSPRQEPNQPERPSDVTENDKDAPKEEVANSDLSIALSKHRIASILSDHPSAYEAAFQSGAAVMARKLAVGHIHKLHGGTLRSPAIITASGRPYQIEGFIATPDRLFAIDVIYNPDVMADAEIHAALVKLQSLWHATPDEDRPRLQCVLCVVAVSSASLNSTRGKMRSVMNPHVYGAFIKFEYLALDRLIDDNPAAND